MRSVIFCQCGFRWMRVISLGLRALTTALPRFLGFHKVKWLHLTGEMGKSLM